MTSKYVLRGLLVVHIGNLPLLLRPRVRDRYDVGPEKHGEWVSVTRNPWDKCTTLRTRQGRFLPFHQDGRSTRQECPEWIPGSAMLCAPGGAAGGLHPAAENMDVPSIDINRALKTPLIEVHIIKNTVQTPLIEVHSIKNTSDICAQH